MFPEVGSEYPIRISIDNSLFFKYAISLFQGKEKRILSSSIYFRQIGMGGEFFIGFQPLSNAYLSNCLVFYKHFIFVDILNTFIIISYYLIFKGFNEAFILILTSYLQGYITMSQLSLPTIIMFED
ncbi:hypothetical protein ACJX0J_032680, partial [Zea mays]